MGKYEAWYQEHVSIVDDLKFAIDKSDRIMIIRCLGELHAVTEKKHAGLKSVIDILTSEDEDQGDG